MKKKYKSKKHASFKTMEIITQHEVEWYFLFSAAECNELKSNFLVMINAGIYGGGSKHNGASYDHPYSDANLNAIDKKRTIEKALKALSSRNLKILRSSFTTLNFPALLTKYFHHYSGAAMHSRLISQADLQSLLTKANNGKNTEQEKVELQEIRTTASNDYQNAITNYFQARHNQ